MSDTWSCGGKKKKKAQKSGETWKVVLSNEGLQARENLKKEEEEREIWLSPRVDDIKMDCVPEISVKYTPPNLDQIP